MSDFWKNIASGGVSSVVSGLVNGAIGAIFRPSLRRQINSQKELMQEQNRINRENYDYQFDKTSPANMVQLYRDAGLNPGLMYSGNAGSGVRASMGSSSTGSLSPYSGGVMTDPSMIANIENIKADTNLKQSSSSLTEEKVVSEKLDQINKELESNQRRLNMAKTDDERNKLQAEREEILARRDLLHAQTQTEIELRPFKKEDIMSDVNFTRAKTKTEDSMRDLNYEYREQQTANAKTEKALLDFKKWYYDTYNAEIPSGVGNIAQHILNAIIGEPGTNRSTAENGNYDNPGDGWSLFWYMVSKFGLPNFAAKALQQWLRDKDSE